jgi:hypothetical protein
MIRRWSTGSIPSGVDFDLLLFFVSGVKLDSLLFYTKNLAPSKKTNYSTIFTESYIFCLNRVSWDKLLLQEKEYYANIDSYHEIQEDQLFEQKKQE